MSFEEDLIATEQDDAVGKPQPELDRLIESEEITITADRINTPTSAPVPVPMQPKLENKEPTMFDEGVRAVTGGLRDAAQNAFDLERDSRQWLNDNLFGLREQVKGIQLPEVEPNVTTGGKIARTLVQFSVPYLGAAKALRAAQVTKGAVTTGLTAGAATDVAVFSPTEGRMADMILEWTDQDPAFGKAVFEYLASDPNDSAMVGRFKNVLEGMGLGLAAEGIFKGTRMFKNHFFGKGENAAEALERRKAEAAEAKAKEQEEFQKNATASVRKDQPQGNSTASKFDEEGNPIVEELDGQPRPVNAPDPEPVTPKAEAKPKEPALDTAHPFIRNMAEGDSRNIAPEQVFVGKKQRPVIHQKDVDEVVRLASENKYDEAVGVIKGTDFNFDRIDTPEDIKFLINQFSDTFSEATKTATKGKQSFKQMKELGEELGAGKKTLEAMFEGTANLGARIHAHRTLLAASAEQVNKLAKEALGGDATKLLSFRKQVALHAAMQAEMKGIQTEVGRALSQFRMTSSSVDLTINERDQLLDAMGGHKVNVEFAKKLQLVSDPKKLNKIIRKGALARTNSTILEVVINGMLSSPATHVVNAVSNSLVAVNTAAELTGSAIIGKVFRSEDAIELNHVGIKTWGMLEGMLDSVKITAEGGRAIGESLGAAARFDFQRAGDVLNENIDEFGNTFKAAITDEPQVDVAAFKTTELGTVGAITAKNFNIDEKTLLGKFTNGLGAIVRLPGRALITADEFFKSTHYRGELKMQAHRKATEEGLTGEAKHQRIAELIENPTPALRSAAIDAARLGTFTAPLGETGVAFTRLMDKTAVGRYVVPFIRTPINLMKYTGVRTPLLNLAAKSVRAEFAAGGARRDLMLSKTILGGSLYALGAYLAGQGIITGGGEKDQTAERLGGKAQYSIKPVGSDTYYSYNRLDPFGSFLGIAADMATLSGQISDSDREEIAAMAFLAIQRNLVKKTYLSGLVELLDVINSGDEGKWTRFMQKFPNTFTPFSALRGAGAREFDPEVKEALDAIDVIKARTPLLSNDVRPQVNLFGEDVHYQGGLGPDFVSPVYSSKIKDDPAAQEIMRLNIDIRKPSRHIGRGSGSKGIKLNKEQYYRYQKLIGNEAKINGQGFHDRVKELIKSDEYRELPETDTELTQSKEMFIRMLYNGYKELGREKLFDEFPALRREFDNLRENKNRALTGEPTLPFPLAE